MSYVPIDPSRAMLLFADLQSGIVELGATNELPRLRRSVGALATLARIFDTPRVVTTAPGTDGMPQLIPEIGDVLG